MAIRLKGDHVKDLFDRCVDNESSTDEDDQAVNVEITGNPGRIHFEERPLHFFDDRKQRK